MKILSFIIPAYNSEKYLDKCVSSLLVPEVLDQLEIIIVNDGSTDGTAAVAEKYCALYPDSVRLITQKNRGHGGALNTGCAAATGKYLKVIDSDDWIESRNLPQFVNLLEQCCSDVVLTHYHTIDISTGEIREWRCTSSRLHVDYTLNEIMEEWGKFKPCLTFHGITYNTAFYHKFAIRLSEHVFYEDYEYATIPCCYAETIMPLDLFLYQYRIGDVAQSVSEINQLKRLSHLETVLNQLTKITNGLTCNESGKAYAAIKTQELLLSYLVTVLLVKKDRKAGRYLAKVRMKAMRKELPTVYTLARKKYDVFLLMNHLYLTKRDWEKILNSSIYRILRRLNSFR